MRKVLARTGFTVLAGLVALVGWNAAKTAQAKAAQKVQDNQIERGKYLVDNVAMCSECHTPRDAGGNLEVNRYLQGAPIWIMPVKPIPNWAQNAPALAGFPYTEEEGERVLEQGTGPEGEVLRPPMHIYHMKPEDAKAIVAYLKSLPSGNR
jgi:mono/diheme cytochrome c family protein